MYLGICAELLGNNAKRSSVCECPLFVLGYCLSHETDDGFGTEDHQGEVILVIVHITGTWQPMALELSVLFWFCKGLPSLHAEHPRLYSINNRLSF